MLGRDMDWVLYLFFWCLWAFLGYLIGNRRGRGFAGAMWGLFLGPIGLLVIFIAGDSRAKCQWCSRPIEKEKRRCKCGHLYSDHGEHRSYVDPVEAWDRSQGGGEA